MAARDRFTYNLKCDPCGNFGVAQASEDDYPFMRSPGYSVDFVPEGFSVRDETEKRVGTSFLCNQCGAVVKQL